MLARRLSQKAMKSLDPAMTDLESFDEDVSIASHSLPTISVVPDASSVKADGDCLPLSSEEVRTDSKISSKASLTRKGEEECVAFSDSKNADKSASLPIDGERVLPLSSEDVGKGRKDTDKAMSPEMEDGDCLPFSSECVRMDSKKSGDLTSSKKSCCASRCRVCVLVLVVVTALAVGLGVGLSDKGREAADGAEEWASKYLPGFPGINDATEDTAGKRDDPTERGSISLWSPAFEYDEPIPIRYTADAGNVSPPLDWSELPQGTQDVVVVCEDVDFPHPDRPASEPFVHWLAYGITSAFGNLPEDLPKEKEVDNIVGTDPATGEQFSLTMYQGITSYGVDIDNSDPLNGRPVGWGYHGPDPPEGDPPHRYYFRILALDGRVKDHYPSDGIVFTMEEVKKLTEGDDPELNVLGFGVLMGRYQKA